MLRVPDAPGWGVELNEDEALKHPYGERNFLAPVRRGLGNPASQIRTVAAALRRIRSICLQEQRRIPGLRWAGMLSRSMAYIANHLRFGEKTMTEPYRGVFTILSTPILPSGEVDWAGLRRVVDFCVECGAHGIVLAGQCQRLRHPLATKNGCKACR